MGAVRTTLPDGLGKMNKGEEGGALMVARRVLRVETGQIGEDLSEGIWTT